MIKYKGSPIKYIKKSGNVVQSVGDAQTNILYYHNPEINPMSSVIREPKVLPYHRGTDAVTTNLWARNNNGYWTFPQRKIRPNQEANYRCYATGAIVFIGSEPKGTFEYGLLDQYLEGVVTAYFNGGNKLALYVNGSQKEVITIDTFPTMWLDDNYHGKYISFGLSCGLSPTNDSKCWVSLGVVTNPSPSSYNNNTITRTYEFDCSAVFDKIFYTGQEVSSMYSTRHSEYDEFIIAHQTVISKSWFNGAGTSNSAYYPARPTDKSKWPTPGETYDFAPSK